MSGQVKTSQGPQKHIRPQRVNKRHVAFGSTYFPVCPCDIGQVNRPWLRTILHSVKMCLNVAGDEHKGQEGFSPTQRFRFCGDGRTSYVDLIRKLISLPLTKGLSPSPHSPISSTLPAWPGKWHLYTSSSPPAFAPR